MGVKYNILCLLIKALNGLFMSVFVRVVGAL